MKTFGWTTGTQDSLCYMKQVLQKINKEISKNRKKNPTQFFETNSHKIIIQTQIQSG